LQSGQDAAARNVIEEVTRIPGTSAKELEEDQLLLRATYFIETHQWKQAATLNLPPGDTFPRDQWQVSWTRTIGAVRSGNASQARLGFQKLRQAGSFLVAKAKKSGYNSAGIETAQLEAEAWLEYAEGRHDEAMRTMRKAVTSEGRDSVDILGIPAQEMLGDLLQELHRPADALKSYEAALQESPNRFDSLYGAAQSAGFAGDKKQADFYFTTLLRICGPGADRPELAAARTYLAER
ncbi:MAG: hypothetical protein KGM47_02080, partial [Acidobacteriota bacterium]|nr:hypothetical protein [Acidobacteriota bacterium]